MNKDLELKPCPLCGEEAEWIKIGFTGSSVNGYSGDVYKVECKHCSAESKAAGDEVKTVPLPYTRGDKNTNDKIQELMNDFQKLLEKAKSFGLDIRLYDYAKSLVLYYNEDYPDTLLVDKSLSSESREEE